MKGSQVFENGGIAEIPTVFKIIFKNFEKLIGS
jgi:hypothetical protein